MDNVLVEKTGHVALVRLNRPDARNAISPEMAVALADLWQELRDDAGVRVIVVTGNGSAFCAGADLGKLIPLMSGEKTPESEAHIVAVGEGLADVHDQTGSDRMRSLHQHFLDKSVQHSIRRGVLRFSLHAYNDASDVDSTLALADDWNS